MRAILVIAAAVALFAGAGCAGSGRPDIDRQRSDEAPPTERDEPEAVALDERPATREEVQWVGQLIDWVFAIERSLEVVATVTSTTDGAVPRGEARHRLEQALAAIAGCERWFSEQVGEPPSERLTVVEANVAGACERYEAGADAAQRLLAGARDAELAHDWEQEWRAASDQMTSVAQQVGDYQPGNAHDLPVRDGVTGASRVEPTFSRVATELVDRTVEVRCWSEHEWRTLVGEASRFSNGRIPADTAGFVTGFEDPRVNLHPDVCKALVALRYERAQPRGGDAQAAIALAVGTLAHEAQHVRGVVNEASAECWGMQMIREAARDLGAPPGYAARLAETYWSEIHAYVPRAYRSPDCRDGGALDASPGDAVWP
ncbi:MAG TPA: hypothetical protein VHF67_07755 [Gaiellaceae bacterium]|nr:hypothetical protein [Gaiellaceae bacterium]